MVDILKQDMTNLWASSGDIVSPTATKIQEGWVVEVVPRQWWNWFENRQDTNIAYMLQKGIPEWDMVTEYLANKSYVQYFGVVYKALLTGVNKTPTTEPTYWKKAFPDSTAASEALSAVTPAADTAPYFTNGTTASTTPLTAFARTILDDVDAAAVRTTISAQTLDATLTAIAGVVTSTNALIYFNGIDTATSTTLTAFGRSLIDDVDAAAGRTTLELSNSATIAATSANTASTIVQRDGSGNFSAGTVTAALTGNASTATILQTARTINGVSFDGSVNITVADATKLPLTGGTLTGNLTFSGAGRRIIGDFSNTTTLNDRTLFQTSTVNDATRVGVIPNGTSSVSSLLVFNNSDTTNSPFGGLLIDATAVQLSSGKSGTGAFLPLKLQTSQLDRVTIATDGAVTIGGSLTVTAPSTITSGRMLATGTGSDYNSGGVELIGNGATNTVFPTLGFHQPSLYGGSLQLRAAGDFRFYNQGATAFAGVTAGQLKADVFELGRQDGTASTPFVDFHSGSTVVDFDTRIISDLPTGATAGGRMSYQANGGHVFTGPLTSGSTLIVNAGITFPGTQVESSGPNVLDDYEEGTFTPTITFTTPGDLSIVYSNRTGEYTKIGRNVSIIIRIATSTFTHSTASGSLLITGLPFGSGSGAHTACAAGYASGILKSGHTQVAPLVATFGSTTIEMYASNISTGALSAITASDTPTNNNQDYIISVTYHV